ncbi:Spherulation-specific family 4 [Aspergillus coremiiformis]|uniref:Spherulation-specific family 4 n=1 Tax=Aspergillus coremiiformis TaxID=138285 RepID=A0A5N6ZFP0_9EURO|nr:Spherulation-specific family 4 [Aspergillus coremiiformis]
MPPPSGIIVPLYIYPLSPTTWAPLYESISAYPHLHFLVVVNPNSGPGASPAPDTNYTREISKLNSYGNVDTVGYIAIGYGKKPLQDVLEEIQTYATWANDYERTGLGVGGIFFDETPNHYSAEAAEYLAVLQSFIKDTPAFLGNRLVIHNPGTPPDAALTRTLKPDLILTCEESYARYRSTEVQRRLHDLHHDRIRSGYVIHSVPMHHLRPLVLELRHRGAYLFVTEFFGEFYERFGPRSWTAFMEALQ